MIPFSVTESISYPTHRVISYNSEIYDFIKPAIQGSYHILAARLFGLTYAEYLRYVRDNYNATLHGKDKGYIWYSFKDIKDAHKLQKDLFVKWIEFKNEWYKQNGDISKN